MGETFPPSEVISLELSHRVSDFWLIARRRCERHRHPWIPAAVRRGCFFFTRVNGWKEEEKGRKREREREEEFVSVFFNHPEKEPRTCRVLRLNRGDRWKGLSSRTCSRLFVAGVSRAIRWTVSCLLDIPWCVLWFLFSFRSGREMTWENRDRERGKEWKLLEEDTKAIQLLIVLRSMRIVEFYSFNLKYVSLVWKFL